MSSETMTAPPAPKRKGFIRRHLFFWFFLLIQVIFLIWVITAAASSTAPTHAEVAQMCAHWQGLWKSYQDCVAHSGVQQAHDVGKGIAVSLIVIIWVIVDFLVGITYGIYRLARR